MPSFLDAATHILVHARPRYWEDAVMDGIVADDDTAVPGRVGDDWRIRIDLTDGVVLDWPTGRSLSVHFKVCDDGEYWLLDADGRQVAHRTGYVPARYLCQRSGRANGDYVVMDIGPDGRIVGWAIPEDDGEGWRAI